MKGNARTQKCKALEIIVGITNVFHSAPTSDKATANEELPIYIDRLINGETLISNSGCSFACDAKDQFKEELLYLRRDSGLQVMADRARKTSLAVSLPRETRIGWHTSISPGNCPAGLEKNLVNDNKHAFPKADVILIGYKDGSISRRIGISVKDMVGRPKLGQLSGETTFYIHPKPITIRGGMSSDVREKVRNAMGKVPQAARERILATKPNLRKEHQDFFVYKSHAPEDWEKLVESEKMRAGESFKELFNGFKHPEHCAHNIMVFLRRTLLGTDSVEANCEYYISSENGLIDLKKILTDEKVHRNIELVHVRDYSSKKGKHSTVIYVKLKGVWYLLVKFESSFDGERPEVSQTKGVISYFQWPHKGLFTEEKAEAPFSNGQKAYRNWTEFLEAASEIAES